MADEPDEDEDSNENSNWIIRLNFSVMKCLIEILLWMMSIMPSEYAKNFHASIPITMQTNSYLKFVLKILIVRKRRVME